MDAAVALQRKKTIKFLCIVDFSLSKQGIFFVLELVGFEQVGRPQTAKNSPADRFLDRGLRIHQLPPKSCGKDVAAAFFLSCIAQNRQRQ